jgi:hypothetical protein
MMDTRIGPLGNGKQQPITNIEMLRMCSSNISAALNYELNRAFSSPHLFALPGFALPGDGCSSIDWFYCQKIGNENYVSQ